MEGREWWSLPSTQHWQDIAGILGPVLSFPVNERHRHTKGNRAKGYWNDAGFEAGESWKLWDSSTFMILWYNLSIERMSLSEHNTGMCPCTDASFYTSPSFLFILLFSPQVGSYSLKLWTPMNVKDILPGMLHILSWALNLNNRWPLVHFHFQKLPSFSMKMFVYVEHLCHCVHTHRNSLVFLLVSRQLSMELLLTST